MKQTIYSIKRTGLVPCIPVLLLTLFVLVSGVQKAAAQDNAFTRLKQAAQGETTEKTQLSKVRITTSNPNWKAVSKTAIPYQPLPMKDANGRTLQPDEMITLKNGTYSLLASSMALYASSDTTPASFKYFVKRF